MSLLLDLQVAQPDQPRGFITTNGQSSGHISSIVGFAGSALLWGSVAVFAPAPVVEAVPLKTISAAPQFDPTQPQPYFKSVVIQQFHEPPLRTILYARGQDSNEQPAPRVTTPSFAPVQPNPQSAQYGYGTQATVAASQSAGGVWGQRLALVPPVVSDPVPFKQVTASPQYVEPTQPLISRTFIQPLLEVPQRPSLYAKGQDSNELLQPGIFKQPPATVAADVPLFGPIRTASPQVPPDVAPLVWRVQIQQFEEPPLRPSIFAKEQESGFQPAPEISATLQVPASQDPILRPIIYARAEDSKYQPAPQVHFGAELPSVTPVTEVVTGGKTKRIQKELPLELRWPTPTPEQPDPLGDVVIQAQIQDVPLPKNPVLALALRKAAEKAAKPDKQVRHKSEKLVKLETKPVIKPETGPNIDEDDDDFFFLT